MKIRILGLCIISVLGGCASWSQKPDIAIVRDGGKSEVAVVDLAKTLEFANLDNMAALSANVYIDNADGSTNSFTKFCTSNNVQYVPGGWHEEPSLTFTPETPPGSYKVNGLGYQVWIKESPGTPPQAIIAFRGTDAKQLGDWISNFRWVTRFIPFFWDQYDQTRALIPTLVESIHKKYGDNTFITTTGHSLGGGLAQQAAYMSHHIRTVYAFDPSVVTGYYSVDTATREISEKGMSIQRIYEHGEILAYIRLIFKELYPLTHADPKIVEVRYNLLEGNGVAQHSMKNFACKLHDVKEGITPPRV